MTHPPFHETLDLTIIGNMGRVHRLCRDVITTAVEPLGLTQSRWTALLHISMVGEGLTQLALANSLGIEMPSLTRTLKQLEHAKLITRQVASNDKRSKQIYFTKQGRSTLALLDEKVAALKSQLYSGLSHKQLDAMAYALINIEKNAHAIALNTVTDKGK
nr:MarR family transcriptional regulator [Pseudoalteromonas sp. MMG010]